jgi:TolB-like protein
MSAPEIFLSYNREDQGVARRFAEAFDAVGLSVWWDVTLRSGEAYDRVTEEALRTAKAVVVLWSPRSVVSRWVRAEATLADRNRTLMPARIEACDLPIMFELTQTADLSHWDGDASDVAWRSFLEDVRRLVTAKTEAAPLAPSTASPAEGPQSHDGRPTIAVLPFINRSGLAEDDAFAEEMVEDVTAALSFNLWMKVVAASATAAYRKGARDLRQIGRDLEAAYLLEGNVRRVSESLRVTAQLVEADNGNILWTRKFDRPLAELSALQDQLVTEVAAHLGVQVQRAELDHALKKPGKITAWESFVRSVGYMCRDTFSGYKAAADEARRAVEIDPNFALAYAQLAYMQSCLHSIYRDNPDPTRLDEINANMRRALMLDSDNPTLLVACASTLGTLLKPRDGLPLAERAVSINSNLDYTRTSLGRLLVQLGQTEEGVAELEASDRLAPNGAWIFDNSTWRSVAYLQSGRLDEALVSADNAVRLLVGARSLVQSVLCSTLRAAGDRARDAMRRLRETDAGIACSHVENIVRCLYSGSDAAQLAEYIAIVRRVWEDTKDVGL